MGKEVITKVTKYGKFRSDSPPKSLIFRYNLSALLFVLIFNGWILWTVLSNLKYVTIHTLILCGLVFGLTMLFVLFVFWQKKKMLRAYDDFMAEVLAKEQEERKFHQEHPYHEAEEFFKQARTAGIADLDSKANISRLFLFAKNNGVTLSQDDIIKQYNLGKQYVDRFEAKQHAQQEHDRLAELRKEEQKLEKEYTRYANLTHQKKLIQICQDNVNHYAVVISNCNDDQNDVFKNGNTLYQHAHQRESSWAIHGGIANGIAGGAAGLAVAADVERRNQEKRQYNKELSSNIAKVSAYQLQNIWDRKRRAEEKYAYWSEKLEESKILLAEDMDQRDLLRRLQPTVVHSEITDTGAVKMKVRLCATPDLYIYDDISAVVDGSIYIVLKADGEIVGSALCVLPFGGMHQSAVIECICCNVKKKALQYTYAFAPNQLWAIETKKPVRDN